jgi:hypothetical protein
MKLDDKIKDRKIAYLFRQSQAVAFELAVLYFVQAKRRCSRPRIGDSCRSALFWLGKAGIGAPEYVNRFSPAGQFEELEKILVMHKYLIESHSYLRALNLFGRLETIIK